MKNPYTASKAHATGWQAGFDAALAGRPRSDCPYNANKRGGVNRHVVTGASGYARAWLTGWDAGSEEKK